LLYIILAIVLILLIALSAVFWNKLLSVFTQVYNKIVKKKDIPVAEPVAPEKKIAQ
jgi:hypothetical protein